MGTARTFVWRDGDAVVAYFSLCPHEVRRDALPANLAHGAPNVVPAILLARLALRRDLHGRRLGEALLLDALGRAVEAVDAAGGRLVVVDAIDDDASGFYQHYGFRSAAGAPMRLFRKASDVARAIGHEPRYSG